MIVRVPTVRAAHNTAAGQAHIIQETSLENMVMKAIGYPNRIIQKDGKYIAEWEVDSHWEKIIRPLHAVIGGEITFPEIIL